MNEYAVRPMESGWYEVAKFAGKPEPAVVYHVRGHRCSCPARTDCKHVALVQEFRRLQEPWLVIFWQSVGGVWEHTEAIWPKEPIERYRIKRRRRR